MSCNILPIDCSKAALALQGGKAFLAVRVTPKASCNHVTGLYTAADGHHFLSVKVTAVPDKGQANKAVLAVLAKFFNLPKSHFQLVKGETDRHKVFEIKAGLERVSDYLTKLSHQAGDKNGSSD